MKERTDLALRRDMLPRFTRRMVLETVSARHVDSMVSSRTGWTSSAMMRRTWISEEK